MTVYDVLLLCAGQQKVQIFIKENDEEQKHFDGEYSKVPKSLEDNIVEELSVKDNTLQLYVY